MSDDYNNETPHLTSHEEDILNAVHVDGERMRDFVDSRLRRLETDMNTKIQSTENRNLKWISVLGGVMTALAVWFANDTLASFSDLKDAVDKNTDAVNEMRSESIRGISRLTEKALNLESAVQENRLTIKEHRLEGH